MSLQTEARQKRDIKTVQDIQEEIDKMCAGGTW